MHKRLVFNVVSRILMVVCVTMLAPLGWALAADPGSAETRAFLMIIPAGLLAGFLTIKLFPLSRGAIESLSAKDGLAVVGVSWVSVAAFSALPLYVSGTVASYTDAFFETVSGFTTTGATIMTDIEALPRGIMFWRSMTHWLGGMGIIVLSVALLPALGRGAYRLYQAEAPGPTAERLRPRIKETAKSLWTVYFLLSLMETLLLMAGKMPLYGGLCHTFGTMATGGFSTKTASIGYYGPYIQWVVVVFMFLAGANFVLHYQALRGRPLSYGKNEEHRTYVSIAVASIIFFVLILSLQAGSFSEPTLRTASFQVMSILTTTGYVTADFDLWPSVLRILLIILMFIGGCAGSTGGGMKVIRISVVVKTGLRSIVQAILPNAVLRIKIDSQPVSNAYITGAAAYAFIFAVLFVTGTVFLTISDSADIVTAYSASIAALSNIGPGLAGVGATQNYAWISVPGKWMLSFLMLAGRLELYAILVLLLPLTWKK